MPQWMSCGEGVPVGASPEETVLVAVTTVVGRSESVKLAVAIGVTVVTMTSVGEVENEVRVELATSMGVTVVSMTSDVMVVTDEEITAVVSVGRMMMDVTVGPSDDVGSSAVVEFANEVVGMGRMLISGVEVMLAKEVKFPGMSTEDVGMGVSVTSGVLMLGKDVKFEGTSKVEVGMTVTFTVVVTLTKVGALVPSVPKGDVEVVELEMGK